MLSEMIYTQWFFIGLLKDYVCQRRTEEPDRVPNWGLIAQYAREQNLSGIIYYQCRNLEHIDTLALQELKKGFLSNAYLAVNTDHAQTEIEKCFDKSSIPYMPIKGAIFRQYYPHPELRTMGDRDILIHHEDRYAADRIMIDLGYKKYVDNHAVWTYYKPNLMFEVHNVMFYENLANQVDYRSYFSRVWDSAVNETKDNSESFRFVPEADRHFLYTVAHTAKHVVNSGMGFRAFLDMVFFWQNSDKTCGKESNWDWIEQELKKLQLYRFACTCFSLCEYWFDVRMPFRKTELDLQLREYVTEKMFHDGIFGLQNEENIGANAAKKIKRTDDSYQMAALKLTMTKLFPPYEDMQLIPWYSWIDGKPWLLPFAWVYRWGYCLKNKARAGKDLLLEPYQKRKQIEERQNYLERWGL